MVLEISTVAFNTELSTPSSEPVDWECTGPVIERKVPVGVFYYVKRYRRRIVMREQFCYAARERAARVFRQMYNGRYVPPSEVLCRML